MKISFKNIAYFAAALFGMSFVSSCSNELEQVSEPEMKKMSITVSTSTPSSRVSATEKENSIEIKWNNNDCIYVGVPISSSKYIQIDKEESGFVKFDIDKNSISADGKTATFTASVPTSWKDGTKVVVAHGRVNNIQSVNNTLRYCYFKLTHRNKEEFLQWYALMGGTATVNNNTLSDVSLQHMGALIKFQLSGMPTGTVRQIVLEGENSETPFFNYVTLDVDNNPNPTSQVTFLNFAEMNTSGQMPSTFNVTENENLIVYRYMPFSKNNLEGKNITIKATYYTRNEESKDVEGDTYVGKLTNLRDVEAGILYTTPVIPMTKQE